MTFVGTIPDVACYSILYFNRDGILQTGQQPHSGVVRHRLGAKGGQTGSGVEGGRSTANTEPFWIRAVSGSLRQGGYKRGLLGNAPAGAPEGVEGRFFEICQLPF